MIKNREVIIGVIVLTILAFFIVFDSQTKSRGGAVSKNILALTQPVTFLSGTVEKVEGQTITVSYKPMLPQIANVATTLSPTPKSVTITYQVAVSDKTTISKLVPYISYLFKAISPAPPVKLSIRDIKVGQSISVTSMVDLRTLSGNVFEAAAINIPLVNVLYGKIVQLGGNTLTIKAFPPSVPGAAALLKEKEYTIHISSETEISRNNLIGSSPKPEKLSASDLKKDMQVSVYTDTDVTNGTVFTALRIEPLVVASAPALPAAQILPPNP